MPRTPKFKVTETSRGWMVNTPATLTASGKRERSYFATRDKAKSHAAKLRAEFVEHGSKASAITPRLAEAATAAERMLEPFNVSLLDAVRQWVEIEASKRASVKVREAVESFRASGESKWSDKQTTAYRLRGDKLTTAFGDRIIATITGEELQRHIEETTGGPGAFNQSVRLVRAIWNWCAKPPRTWCQTEAVEHLEAKETTSGEIGVLSAAEAAALMKAAADHHPETVPAFAIALFTGMRQAEIDRLRPKDITPDGITVPAISAKTKRRRFIAMPEPLADWLAAFPIGERVCPPNWSRKERAVRRLAGWRVWSDMVEPAEPPKDAPEWPANALRHTAATVAVALGKPIEQLVFEHGHTGGLEMLRRHYVGALRKSEAVKIWNLRPKGKTARNLRTA